MWSMWPPFSSPSASPRMIPARSTAYPASIALGPTSGAIANLRRRRRGLRLGVFGGAGSGARLGHPSGGRRDQRHRARLDRPSRVRNAVDPAGLDERVDDLGIELDPGELAELAERLLVGQRLHAVRARGRHRLERVGDVEDAGQLRDLLAQEPVGIARAVVPLVVVANDRQLRGQPLDRGDDLRAQDRVRVHHLALFAGQAVRLQQDVVRDADLADVVEQAAPLDGLHLARAQAHHPADVRGDLLDPPAVVGGLRIALVHGMGQGLDGLGEHLAHLDEALIGEADHVQRQGIQRGGPPADSLVRLGHEPRKWRQGDKAGDDSPIAPAKDAHERRLRAERQDRRCAEAAFKAK